MNEFRFNHLRNRSRLKLPRPIIYVGVAIILLAFFSIKTFQRAAENETVPAIQPPVLTPQVDPLPETDPVPVPEETGEGILALDGEGTRLQPPQRISGERPVIPEALFEGHVLVSPRVYVRVGRGGQVTDVKLVSSSGNGEVDRLVLEALQKYTFQPAVTAGQTVEYASVVTIPLTPGS